MRLIDADALNAMIMTDAPGFLDGGSSITKAFIMAMVGSNAATPTIDAVPIVRCKYCKYWHNDLEKDKSLKWLPCQNMDTSNDWFCADGEKRCKEIGG